MYRSILSVICLIAGVTSNPILSQSNNQRPKIVRPKAVKYFKRGAAAGTALGTTIPALKELTQIPSEFNTIKTNIESDENIDLPSSIVRTLKPNYDTWSYSDLFDHIYSNNIVGVSIHQDSKYLYAIDNGNSRHVELHYVTTIPSHINELIDQLLVYNIHFDIFN